MSNANACLARGFKTLRAQELWNLQNWNYFHLYRPGRLRAC